MGDPKKPKKKYRRPLMVWNEERIARDKDLIKEFGLVNKKEIWKAESKLASIHDQAKNLLANPSPQSNIEAAQLKNKLSSLNLIQKEANLDDILSLTLKDLLNRRLQTIVFKRGMSKTIKQARQFITHNHVSIKEQVINTPSYMVKLSEESFVTFIPSSPLANEMHAERPQERQKVEAEILEEVKPKEAKPKQKKETKAKEVKEKEIKKVQPEQVKEQDLSKEEKLEEAVPEERKTHKEK
ncbi:30S ribosomal protein S4 [Candidatus Woesearchaeota archaeon]|nr:30S ribosomal protein S4 [Candidatus Woesearchaeota archaeon]